VGTAEGAVAPLRAFVDRYFRMMEDPDCRSSLALDIRLRGEALDSEVVRHELRTAYETQVRQIAKHLSEARARTGKRREAISMARALVGLLNEAGVQALLIPDFDIPAYRGTVLRLIDAWMEGKPHRK
ncbi:MAG: hypothetical protein ACOC91_00835, partial [bacterium]